MSCGGVVFAMLLPSPFVIALMTNNVAAENYYTIRDMNGTVVHQNGALTDNTLSLDTIDLPLGCYTFDFQDLGHDGLFFFIGSDGTGWLQFRDLTGDTLVEFPADMGSGEQLSFTTTPFTGIGEHPFSQLLIYPNPARDAWHVVLPPHPGAVRVGLFDATGRLLRTMAQPAGARECTISATGIPPGTYLLRIGNGTDEVRRMLVRE